MKLGQQGITMKTISFEKTKGKLDRMIKAMPDGDWGWQRIVCGLYEFVLSLPTENVATVNQLKQLRDELIVNGEITQPGLKRLEAMIKEIERGTQLNA